jgi:hypothetical protein
MSRRVAFVRADVSEIHFAVNIRVTRIKVFNMLWLLVTANVVPSSPILLTLMMEALRSSHTSVLTTATGRNIPEGDNRHSHCRETLKLFITLTGWAL